MRLSIELTLIVLGLMAAMAFLPGLRKPKSPATRIVYFGGGVLIILGAVVIWGGTGRGPLENAYCGISRALTKNRPPACGEPLGGGLPVVPEIAGDLRPIELSDLLIASLPSPEGGSGLSWSSPRNAPVAWTTPGYVQGASPWYVREGWARVRIKGDSSRILEERQKEMAWSIRLSTSVNPNLGAQEIQFKPGGAEDGCLGPLTVGCDIDAFAVLIDSGLTYQHICSNETPGSATIVFSISYPRKRTTTLIYEGFGGSAGYQGLLLLSADDPDQWC